MRSVRHPRPRNSTSRREPPGAGVVVISGPWQARRGDVRSTPRHHRSNAGTGYELQAIGAAVIGGVASWSRHCGGAAFGAFLLATINSALPVLGIESWQRAAVGVDPGRDHPRPGARSPTETASHRRKDGARPRLQPRPSANTRTTPMCSALFTREMAIIGLLLLTLVVAGLTIPLRRSVDRLQPVPRHVRQR